METTFEQKTTAERSNLITGPALPLYEYKRADYAAMIGLFVISLLGFPMALWGGFRAGYSIFFVLTFIIITVYLASKKRYFGMGAFAFISGCLALVSSLAFSVSGNSAVNTCLFLVTLLLGFKWFGALAGWNDIVGVIPMVLDSVFGNLGRNFGTVIRSLGMKKDGKKSPLITGLIGAAVSLPVLAVVTGLLISSDAAFSGLVNFLVGDPLLLMMKAIAGLCFAPFVVVYAVGLRKSCQRFPAAARKMEGIEAVAVNSFLAVLSACYLLYLFSQSAYFFSAFSGLLPEEFTFAEYARRGFFEMSVIAVINFALVSVSAWAVKKRNEKTPVLTKVLDVFISVFTLIIIGTALSKMIMYMREYGLTRLRLETSMFMIFLAVVFIVLIIRVLGVKIPVFKIALCTACVILAVSGFAGINRVVGEYNTEAYFSGKLEKVDIETIYELGPEGIPSLVRLASAEDKDVADEAKTHLEWLADSLYDYDLVWDEETESYLTFYTRPSEGLGGWNYLRDQAFDTLDVYLESAGKLNK
ncbi:MAG: DUF4173 domain-containing protein [Oscillospiraceae bacterium]|nr:DUF4173 domain-containing protein [Oscillospiraceae bacterium]